MSGQRHRRHLGKYAHTFDLFVAVTAAVTEQAVAELYGE